MTALAQLLALLDLEGAGNDCFLGHSPPEPHTRVFGGQVLAQALVAAARTVAENRLCHSLHAYFLRPGDPALPILYRTERIADGMSFSARRVVALQRDAMIFTLAASFQRAESGLDHQAIMPVVTPPEALPDDRDTLLADPTLPPPIRGWLARERAFETRSVVPPGPFDADGSRAKRAALDHIWLRAKGEVGGSDLVQRALLAFVSDLSLLGASLLPHGKSFFSPLQVASLDHALWFHRPVRCDDWLLYVQDSPSASGARGFSRGSIFARDGTLVASVAQEGLIRAR